MSEEKSISGQQPKLNNPKSSEENVKVLSQGSEDANTLKKIRHFQITHY